MNTRVWIIWILLLAIGFVLYLAPHPCWGSDCEQPIESESPPGKNTGVDTGPREWPWDRGKQWTVICMSEGDSILLPLSSSCLGQCLFGAYNVPVIGRRHVLNQHYAPYIPSANIWRVLCVDEILCLVPPLTYPTFPTLCLLHRLPKMGV